MKVKELIAYLQQFDGDMDVALDIPASRYWHEICSVSSKKLAWLPNGTYFHQPWMDNDSRMPNPTTVILSSSKD